LVRVVGHIDLDYFYAQVEEVLDPSLKAKPVLVCVFSGRTEDSGVVATANYRARELGIKSGIPIATAKRKLQGIEAGIIKMQHEKYEAVSERVMELVEGNVDVLEQTGIDEWFFDITGESGGNFERAKVIGARIKNEVLRSEGLTCSVGLGQSKVVAKIASDFRKPDGLTVVPPESTISFLNPLPVVSLYGVGPKAAKVFEVMGVGTIGDLSRASAQDMEEKFGRRLGAYFLAASTGSDTESVTPRQAPTQLSRIVTLKQNTSDPEVAFEQLAGAVQDLHRRLGSRASSFRTISAMAILSDLTVKTKSKTFETPIKDLATMSETTKRLLAELSGTAGKEFRRVGIRVSDLASSENQSSLSQFFGQESKA
jgi:DNA polymerase IV (archaeal DinB-like DNA polymerase)